MIRISEVAAFFPIVSDCTNGDREAVRYADTLSEWNSSCHCDCSRRCMTREEEREKEQTRFASLRVEEKGRRRQDSEGQKERENDRRRKGQLASPLPLSLLTPRVYDA